MVILEDICMLQKSSRRNKGVKGERQGQVWIGLKTSSLQPYAYFSQRLNSS